MLELKKITLAYQGRTVLENINLQFERGTVTVLTGSSGSGKSSLIKLLNGVVPHFTPAEIEGDILYNGASLQDLDIPQRSRVMATVFQNPKSQFFTVHSRDELAFGLENRNLPPKEIGARITRYTKLLHVEDLLDCDLFKLSGGEKQLIAITATACLDQDIYLFDEPSASLDGHYIERLRKTIVTLKELGKTILIAEHRLYYLRELMDRLLVLEGGSCHSYDCSEVNEAVLQRHNLRRISAISKTDLGKICNQPIYDSTPCSKGRLECRKYAYAFTKQSKVFDFNLSFEPGVHFIIGPNGIGKSTFFELFMRFEKRFSWKNPL